MVNPNAQVAISAAEAGDFAIMESLVYKVEFRSSQIRSTEIKATGVQLKPETYECQA